LDQIGLKDPCDPVNQGIIGVHRDGDDAGPASGGSGQVRGVLQSNVPRAGGENHEA
jgi:hypothetical protein